ncbi:hypothetical protein [Oryza sativa Japonica Group]|uniref:Os01g0286400 protein n=1 Tax=Oryza sativa subsp. japonica TaxID=39947 RepID=A0A0P0V1B7_ORYSJ|nr:hypothetical protein OsJ_01349 [Oryza sativa Japonica Group]BAD81567.1 hypothetical protein [Oryza sativa Japonica Group]BAS71629.1 Os01g0286400 [Oryza sativa Japonica Group]
MATAITTTTDTMMATAWCIHHRWASSMLDLPSPASRVQIRHQACGSAGAAGLGSGGSVAVGPHEHGSSAAGPREALPCCRDHPHRCGKLSAVLVVKAILAEALRCFNFFPKTLTKDTAEGTTPTLGCQ